MEKDGEVVCVTGGSGCIGSWLVRELLHRGYNVHATIQDLKDENETKHLEGLEGAETRLRLFQIDLLDYPSILRAVNGCAGVFHLASPCIVDQVQDPHIKTTAQLDAALSFFGATASEDFKLNEFEEACGVGVEVSVEEIEQAVNEVFEENKNVILEQPY
ncbi:bifunctional dihydroflavonol 4-reductase/flavanone 4-reductase-like [Quercus lobata]|uniref:Glutaminyl-tRNA synthetase class Ib non-specific RNA-binding domain-containing protein n=1 Tax=Quercus lobata TaxID=97700 RepID=A0A7N2L434_QUELO|nr:bifunctional dihydroflavonol 4-reductase/flavanone 4-reductase-like [Quercus lobata]XP_030962503.1 bifunctional dihydroflavonol 4-reductase/flavanone 4-reductase-like [Quercus lobata]